MRWSGLGRRTPYNRLPLLDTRSSAAVSHRSSLHSVGRQDLLTAAVS